MRIPKRTRFFALFVTFTIQAFVAPAAAPTFADEVVNCTGPNDPGCSFIYDYEYTNAHGKYHSEWAQDLTIADPAVWRGTWEIPPCCTVYDETFALNDNGDWDATVSLNEHAYKDHMRLRWELYAADTSFVKTIVINLYENNIEIPEKDQGKSIHFHGHLPAEYGEHAAYVIRGAENWPI